MATPEAEANHLRIEVAELQAGLERAEDRIHALLDAEDGYKLEIANLSIINRDLRSPCRCDPPGSGDACNGVCLIRQALAQSFWGRAAWSDLGVMWVFDLAVSEVMKGRTL